MGSAVDAHNRTQPGFALIGGGTDLDAAFQWLCARSGGGDFLVLRATGTDAYNPYIQGLCHENSVATLLIPDRKAAFDPEVRRRIAEADAIFISGGDQAKYIDFWMHTPVRQAINEAIRRGIPVGGTSAGLAVLGEFAYSAQKDPAEGPDLTSAMALHNPLSERVTIVRDFLAVSPLKGTITDTHFSRRDRMGRLLVFMARILQTGQVRTVRAIGVDEHTAVLLDRDGQGMVVGTGSAYFLRAAAKASACRRNQPLTFSGISVVKAQAGAHFDTVAWKGDGARYELSVDRAVIHSTQAGGSVY